MTKIHPIFEQALAPFLKPIATRNGPERYQFGPSEDGTMSLMHPSLSPTDKLVKASDYEALAAELAEARSERQREHDLRVKFAGHVEALEAAIRGWMHEGRMQSFGDRERMRAEMASCLPLPTPLATTPYPWCRQKDKCRGKGSCPLDPTCGD